MVPSRVLMTGATGYVGLNVASRLVKDGFDVYALVRRGSNTDQLERACGRIVTFIYDGTYRSILSAVKSCSPEIILHLASLFIVNHQEQDVDPLIASNVLLPVHLAEACARSGVRRILNVATGWQFNLSGEYRPVNLYAATKQAFEDILEYYWDAQGLSCISLVLNDTYGPNDFRPKLLPKLQRAIETNEVIRMSPGEQLVDFVHINDVVDAFALAVKRIQDEAPLRERYLVSSGSPIAVRDLIALVESIVGAPIPVELAALPYRDREVMNPYSSGNPVPGWEAKISLNEGLRDLFSRPL